MPQFIACNLQTLLVNLHLSQGTCNTARVFQHKIVPDDLAPEAALRTQIIDTSIKKEEEKNRIKSCAKPNPQRSSSIKTCSVEQTVFSTVGR